jgi:hypothetical protein
LFIIPGARFETGDAYSTQDEITTKEFAQFTGKEMVLAHGHRVEYAPRAEVRPDLQLLHGQEHAGAQRLHHGQAGRAGGGVANVVGGLL